MKTHPNPSFLRISLLMLVAAAIAAFGGCSRKNESPTIVAMLPLTGDLAFLGEPGQTALRLAQEDLQQRGIRLGVEAVDTKASAKETVTLMRREIDVNNRRIFLVTLSGPAMAAREAFARDNVAMVAVAIHPDLPSPTAPMVRFCFSARQEGDMLAAACVKTAAPIGLILSKDAATTYEAEHIIIPALKKAGKPIAFVHWFDVGATDFHELTAHYKESRPAELLLLGYGSDFAAALGSVAVTKSTSGLTVFGGIGFVELGAKPSGFDDTKFQIAAPAFSLGSASPAAQEFRARYQKARGTPPPYDAAFTYDAIMSLGAALQSGNSEPQSLLASLRNHSFQGVSGQISIGQNGEARTEVLWGTYANGQLAEFRP